MITHLVYLVIILALVTVQYIERKKLYERFFDKGFSKHKDKKRHSFKTAHNRVLEKWRGKDGE